ncbi:hypothetical protein DAPPUDRAFT_119585 [Daphnia pulex]|uniref:Uncharacterized protein n=1 Tax=Daphnia pulex TaxID=6669 RepID=E9HYY5_DAPPU|nr:hypothetical protein DAPPUDRAFT_119585 [Daphnia pulex]|eukprot:EFX63046.1 hypothetical protein DAPPUDRAFT_119585 [Daphnia pulex]
MSVPKNRRISSLLIGSQASEGRAIYFLFCFSVSVFNGRLLSLKIDGNVIFKKGPTARELRRNAHRRETTKKRKEDKAKDKAQGEPSSRPRCLGALRSPENSESTKRKKTAKSLATKKPRMDNPDNSVSSPSANVFSTELENDITQLDDRFDVSRQEKLAQSGEQLLKMIVDVATIFNDIPSSCYPENENAKGASWAERMENMDSLWEGVRESVYNNFLSKHAGLSIGNSMFQSPVLTMQDFGQGYFPWLLVEGSWREEISFYESFRVSDDSPLFSAQEHLNKVSLVCRLLTEKIERSTRRTIAADGDSFEKVRESISVDFDTVVRNNENNEKQYEYQESLKTMNKASEILLGFINNRSSALTLTHADVLVGIFPWNKPEISFMEKFNIVDTWKLWQRSQEEIVQSEKEMTQFIKTVVRHTNQIARGSTDSKANIVLLEINRLANTLENAISSFRRDSSLSVIIDTCADLENDKESVIQYNELEEEDDESDYESSSEDEDD